MLTDKKENIVDHKVDIRSKLSLKSNTGIANLIYQFLAIQYSGTGIFNISKFCHR
ncbi:hypothetical protein HMPREF9997_02736 [Corynebacterium durum F0235]|uniref:Uncharacterized protein n=1 Tax=Corynebacterium durum F0235 TaxID=1035195 RepID=L1M8P0_9CORY|nr:hypothetical protein HMPREF9997_02736 [Corynebacterium durum F0235]